eukprot:TRINITY_DN32854_c0_g1_i1.p1 TRINITY_DN32854_c0_g1~~TRINITY_DN32854_c0_g1_i1.p1  ORF type:complete len:856 (+),score=313.48 TRINITY_DN32854_c0_g1_i1:110-2569(+)
MAKRAAEKDEFDDSRRTFLVPLSGAHSDSPACYLLELGKGRDHITGEHTLGGYNILLDCGWTDDFDVDRISPIVDQLRVRGVDCILLSGPGIKQLGGLVYLMQELGRQIPVYATPPVAQMGLISLYDAHGYRAERVGKVPFTEDQMNSVFGKIRKLKFYETHRLQNNTGDVSDIFISPQPAGYMLGACAWHIVRDSDEVVYAPALNHKRERHLPGADLVPFSKATIAVMGCANADDPPPAPDRDQRLIDVIMSTLRHDGNVLIPCDITGRVLEVLSIVETHWTERFGDDSGSPYSLVFLSEYAECTATMADQALEFMSDVVRKTFESTGFNPMSFVQRGVVRFCRSKEELDELTGPSVVFATPASMNIGLSQDLFLDWAGDPRNAVVLVDAPARDTVAHSLAGVVEKTMHGGEKEPMFVSVHHQVPLDGEELESWRAQERVRRQDAEAEKRGERRTVREIIDEELARGDSDDDGSDDEEGADGKQAAEKGAAETTPGLFLPRGLAYKSQHLMFPCLVPDEVDLFVEDYGMPIEETLMKQLKRAHDDVDVAQEVLAELAREEAAAAAGQGGQLAQPVPPMSVPSYIDDRDAPKKHKSKLVSVWVEAKVVTGLHFGGRADGDTLKHLIALQCPHAQELVIVNTPPSTARGLIQHCSDHQQARFHHPRTLERVEVTSSTSMFRIRIGDDLIEDLDFTNTGEYKVASVEGIVAEGAAPQAKRQRTGPHQRNQLPLLRKCDADEERGGHKAVFIGELALRDLSGQLKQHGWRAEFRKGCLVGGVRESGSIVVRRGAKSTIAVGGSLSPEWFKFRERLRSNFKVL